MTFAIKNYTSCFKQTRAIEILFCDYEKFVKSMTIIIFT